MRLVRATSWAKETFALGSRPTKDTIVGWIRGGVVPGKIIDGQVYVDAEKFALSGTESSPPPQDAMVDLFS